MRFKKALIVATAVAGLAITANANAQPGGRDPDYCIEVFDSSYTLVGRGFTPPAAGGCRDWRGFLTQQDDNNPSSGSCCMSSDGTDLSCTITSALRFYILTDHVDLQPQGGVDDQTLEYFNQQQGGMLFSAMGGPCAKTMPIPTNNQGDF